MALEVSVDWPNSIINVTRSGLTLVQSNPTEIRQMDLNEFRLKLKDLEDNPEGITYLKTHDHNPEVTVGGVTLAEALNVGRFTAEGLHLSYARDAFFQFGIDIADLLTRQPERGSCPVAKPHGGHCHNRYDK